MSASFIKIILLTSINLSVKLMKKAKPWESICCLIRCHFFLYNDSQTSDGKALSKLGWLLLWINSYITVPKDTYDCSKLWRIKTQTWVCTMRSLHKALPLPLSSNPPIDSGLIQHPRRVMICIWYIELLTPDIAPDPLTTYLLIKAASVVH